LPDQYTCMENLFILPQRKISPFVQVVGFIFFSILFYFSWVYYLERMLYVDDAFYFFRLLQADKPISALNRYGDYIAQLLPYVAYKMEYPLHTVLMLYSVSFIILHYLIFLFVTLILKNNGAGIAIMLASCLTYFHAFYTPLVQLNESIIAACMLWAFIHPETPYNSNKEKYLYLLGALITIFYMSFLHPLGFVAILFVFGIEFIGAKRLTDKYLWATMLLGMGWFFAKILILYRTDYDRDHMIPLHEMIVQIPNWKQWPSTKYIENLSWLHFRSLKWLGILFILLCLRKGFAFFSFVLLFVLGFTLLYFVTLYKGESAVYYEDYFCYYGFFIGMLFVFLLYHPRRKNLVLFLSLPLLYSGVHKIYQAHFLFTDRVAYLNRIIDQAEKTKEKKCIVEDRCYPYNYAMVPWNVAFETMIYSAMRGRDSTVTVFVKKPDFQKLCTRAVNTPGFFMGVQFSPDWFKQDEIPEEYFKLPVNSSYTYITHSQADTSFHESNFSASNIKIIPLLDEVNVKVDDWTTVVEVEIINTSGKIIPAVPRAVNGIYLTYTLYNDKGVVIEKGVKEPLETDAGPESKQGIIVYYPPWSGKHTVVFDLMTEGKGNWNIPVKRVAINFN
jgi:hypothetical protein